MQSGSSKETAVVVCPSGVSSSLMVRRQLESLFQRLSLRKRCLCRNSHLTSLIIMMPCFHR
ncbi:hypothetical protein PO124_27520 [Bacillus licheniformis]|nr:hypothetical protein [Bacillus licheniformis]